MNALTKTASVCANVYINKKANVYTEGTERIVRGAEELAQGREWLKALRGKDSFPMWAKITAALGGGKLLLDSQGNKSRGWRD